MPTHDEFGDAPYIETYQGHRFTLEDPVFDIVDIAHALANTTRYGGHCRRFYSVAEHSVMVSEMVEYFTENKDAALLGLMHDATEAYLSDVPAPFKQFLPDWRAVDADLEKKLARSFNLATGYKEVVKQCDWIALFLEAEDLIPSGGRDWPDPAGAKGDAKIFLENGMHYVRNWNPRKAERKFLERYKELTADEIAPEGLGWISRILAGATGWNM